MGYQSIIALGRQYGSGGRDIGALLAKKMDVPFYDRELIALAAQKSGISSDVFENIDETATNSLLYALSTGAYMFSSHFSPVSELPLNDKLYVLQNNIINDISKNGACVIVGRCADYILRENPHLVSIFIHAPTEERAKRIATKENISVTKAQERMIKIDKKRANYYNFYTNKVWGEISNYEISLDSSRLGPEGSADLLLAYIDAREHRNKDSSALR